MSFTLFRPYIPRTTLYVSPGNAKCLQKKTKKKEINNREKKFKKSKLYGALFDIAVCSTFFKGFLSFLHDGK